MSTTNGNDQFSRASFLQWLNAQEEDNHNDLEWAKKVLPIALQERCTERQRMFILHYFVGQMTIVEIANKYGLTKSAVSRTINRGLDNIFDCIKFASPASLAAKKKRGSLNNGRRRKERMKSSSFIRYSRR